MAQFSMILLFSNVIVLVLESTVILCLVQNLDVFLLHNGLESLQNFN